MECIRILLKRTIGGSGDVGAGEAPTQGMKLGTKLAVVADEVSHGLDFVRIVVPPHTEPEVHSYSINDYDSDEKLFMVSPPSVFKI